jgi:hypothetical protein
MDADDQTVNSAQPAQRASSIGDEACANCAERTYLRIMVAELLYKNQVLRFELLDVRERLARFTRDHIEMPYEAKSIRQSRGQI